MENVTREELLPGVFLTAVKTDQFKTSFMSVNFLHTLRDDRASLAALTPHVLRRGFRGCPDMRAVSERLEGLYGAALEPVVRKKGDVQCVGFVASTLEDQMAAGSPLINELAGLTGACLTEPLTENGVFLSEYVRGEKENLRDRINAQINDKRIYARLRLNQLMLEGEPAGLNELGSLAGLDAADAASLFAFWRSAAACARIELFFCGSGGQEKAREAFGRALEGLPARKAFEPADTSLYRGLKPERFFEESLDVTQGKLSLGFRTGVGAGDPDFPAMMMLNAVYGGSLTSKLFMNVRERLSLCYYASSAYDKFKGTLNVFSGIDFDQFGQARDEILNQLEACRRGEISDEELGGARMALQNALLSQMDAQGELEDFYLSQAVCGLSGSQETLAKALDGVDLEQVARAARRVQLDTVYFLKGGART